MDAIKTTGLSKAYGKKLAVNNLEMTVPEGTIYGFIGQNGAGKSTTQKLICGLTPPTTGSIQLYGKAYTDADIRSKIGMLIENAGVYSGLTAKENMRLYGLAIGVSNLDNEINRILKLMGLQDTGKKKVKQFSLGMKQRLGIAIALLGNPRLLILDEPINGLDPQGIIEFRDIVTQLNQEYGMTILISSHILGELSKIATHYGIISNGHMVKELSAQELEQTCQNYLSVRLNKPSAAAKILKQSMPLERYELIDEMRELRLFGIKDSRAVNRLLWEKGFEVDEIFTHKQDLEEYFLNLMGGGTHV
ncbi:MAG: ATP-binding cassette domain-containing protein [Clostridiales bacterium]|nr:ATP-binding cassette domain-containing protein [Clostridiales bacterium]